MSAQNPISIKHGLDIPLAGAPAADIADAGASGVVTVYPPDVDGIKPRLKVEEGDRIKRGGILFYNKRNDAQKFRSPVAGTVKSIVIGQRRAVTKLIIEATDSEEAETFPHYDPAQVLGIDRNTLLSHLQDTGLIVYIRQRPFSRMADASATPKSIFVNGMATAPFQADPALSVRGREAAFQAGLNALTRLTEGKVYLCLDARRTNLPEALTSAGNVEIIYFRGPHPSGNTSVHIHHVDPIKPHDTVWTVQAADLVLIGRLLVEGKVPGKRIVALAGPGVKEEARKHYLVNIGESLDHLLQDRFETGELRMIRGNILSGTKTQAGDSLHALDNEINLIAEGRERLLLGWVMPGLTQYSRSRSFLSRWLKKGKTWTLNTNMHGNKRAMVLTGLYDRYIPLHLMSDFLIRAVLARDTDEAIKLGILETDPEDFALASFVCPSKTDIMGIIRRGLQQIEREGI